MKVGIVVMGVGSLLALSACSSVNDAISSGQNALDSAGQVVEAADGLIQAATDLAAACAAAQAAWVPGVSAQDARAAIDQAVGIVDGVVASVPDAPGVSEIDHVLTSAQEALAADPSSTSLGVPRSTLETACALVTLGG